MAINLPLRMTYEHAAALSLAIDAEMDRLRGGLRTLGYSDDTIELEIGLQLGRRATNFLDVESTGDSQPVNGHGNGVNKL